MIDGESLKRAAGEAALAHVESDMVVGLGTGSTVEHFLVALGEALRDGRLTGIVGVPTSIQTERRALEVGIRVIELGAGPPPDVAVDGADEIAPGLDLVKGMGGALLREKMVAQAAARFVVIADGSKVVDRLGVRSPLPVEVVEWGADSHSALIEALGARVAVRRAPDGTPERSDNGNLFLDCTFEGGIPDPAGVAEALAGRAGVVETGLFLGLAHVALVAAADGVHTLLPDR